MTTDEIAKIFADAKDAPTSFEDETWLEGFEDGRQIIAYRFAEIAFPKDMKARRAFCKVAKVKL